MALVASAWLGACAGGGDDGRVGGVRDAGGAADGGSVTSDSGPGDGEDAGGGERDASAPRLDAGRRDAGPAECSGSADGDRCSSGHCCGGTCALDRSIATCGSSCTPCPRSTAPHMVPTCDGTACGAACDTGYMDCDADAANGCETHRSACAPTTGLVAFYPLDGDATDMSSSGASGTLHGVVAAMDRFGRAAHALHFTNMARDYIEVADNAALPDGSEPRTLSVWVRTTGMASSYQSVVNWGTDGTHRRFGVSLYLLSSSTTPHRYAPMFTAQFDDLRSMTSVETQWHHVVVTYDGTTVTLWVDGVRDMMRAASLDTMGRALFISRKVSVDGEYVDGEIDDLRIYDRVLSSTEIGDVYHELGWGS